VHKNSLAQVTKFVYIFLKFFQISKSPLKKILTTFSVLMIEEANARHKFIQQVNKLHFLFTRMIEDKALEFLNFRRFLCRRISHAFLLLIHQCRHHFVTKVGLNRSSRAAENEDATVAVVLVLAVKIQAHDDVKEELPEGLDCQFAQRPEAIFCVLNYGLAKSDEEIQRVALNFRICE
jgi:hypothetical protein